MNDEREQLHGAYRDFNARRLEAVLARMQPDVVWPKGWRVATSMDGRSARLLDAAMENP